MLSERTACERFATLFWGVFDPVTSTLRYVNAGHAAPMLMRAGQEQIERLKEGGPVLGMLPKASYSAGTVKIGAADTLVLYSDGINESTNRNEEEFGDDRIKQAIVDGCAESTSQLCHAIMNQIHTFANGAPPQDDRTLLVVKFPKSASGLPVESFQEILLDAVA
jgi:sigma-B regulation protein RsbU (phosphoserine phosphatase)